MVAAHPASLLASLHFTYVPRERQSKSPKKGLSIQDMAGGEPWHGARFDLVDRRGGKIQWHTSSDSAFESDSGDHRIWIGMGYLLSGSVNRWTVDPTGETEAHQLPRAACSRRSIEEFPTEQEEIDHSSTDRQCDSNHFSEHNGWYPFSGALTFSSENLGVVHREGDRYSIRTPPWQRECQSGDWESQHMRDSSDWMLERATFLQLESSLGLFSIDLFASQTNAQLPVYCSWRLDPAAWPWMPCPYLGRIITHMCSHHSP